MIAVDLFCGWGGFTEGATAAGVTVAWAANHCPLAVRAHQANHPETIHACQDLRQANWSALPDYELLLAAPACQGHSSASQPKRRAYHDGLRATAWAVIDCADATRPEAIIVENVPNFRTWELFRLWCQALVTLGYHVQDLNAHATGFGVPQRRHRMIIVATKKLIAPIRLPIAKLGEEPAFGSCLEFNAGRWRDWGETTAMVRARFRKGRANHGKRFLSQHTTGHPGVSLDEPIRTITTKDQWVIVDGDQYRPLTVRELARGMSFRDSYSWPDGATRIDSIKGLGNAVPPKLGQGVIEIVRERIS